MYSLQHGIKDLADHRQKDHAGGKINGYYGPFGIVADHKDIGNQPSGHQTHDQRTNRSDQQRKQQTGRDDVVHLVNFACNAIFGDIFDDRPAKVECERIANESQHK